MSQTQFSTDTALSPSERLHLLLAEGTWLACSHCHHAHPVAVHCGRPLVFTTSSEMLHPDRRLGGEGEEVALAGQQVFWFGM